MRGLGTSVPAPTAIVHAQASNGRDGRGRWLFPRRRPRPRGVPTLKYRKRPQAHDKDDL